MSSPWDHPDWYDLHDTTAVAGVEREPEHYRELVVALPPLDHEHHVIDAGAGTGKLAGLVATSYPDIGRLTLIEPCEAKLDRALRRLRKALPPERVDGIAAGLGLSQVLPHEVGDLVLVGSVLMPIMEWRGGTFAAGHSWVREALADLRTMLRPGGWVYALETVAMPWAKGEVDAPVRRLKATELWEALVGAGFTAVECTYRFRDRIALRARKPGPA